MKENFSPVQVGRKTGYLFESTLGEGVCFVPEECIRIESNDQIGVDEIAYLAGGWPRKNAFANPAIRSHRLFPNPQANRSDIGTPTVTAVLRRIQKIAAPVGAIG